MKGVLLAGTVLAAAVIAAAARADGLPVLGVDVGSTGVTSPAGDVRYVTLAAKKDTVVAAIEPDGGRVLRSALLPGRFTVPAVAYDGSAAGLSADGKTLVLIRPRTRFPRARTPIALVAVPRLRLREIVTLRGDFSFDAISPDGSALYLVEYPSRRDPTRYLVRLYDVRAGRLLPEPIIDPREVGDVMRGSPITRAASPDGRWAYTLYDGAGEHPFVHALDTSARTARCIDLHDLTGYPNLHELRLETSTDGSRLTVVDGDEPVALVDTETFAVGDPAAQTTAPGPKPPIKHAVPRGNATADGGSSWPLLAAPAGGALLAGAAVGIVLLRRRRRLAPV